MLDPLTQTLHLNNRLTLDMLLSIENKFLIKVPREVNKVDLNIHCYNSQEPLKYVALFIPIIMDSQALDVGNAGISSTAMNLEITLMPGGNHIIQEIPLMKFLL
ncbi:hypothetical protein RDI58_027147 [Solanum bulbocastanum]|uniref:Uncharacterized protein n=1 Tax=Solanum bulbocastanum TaxID=147425 RepID=A0AAN8T089_SOLBU